MNCVNFFEAFGLSKVSVNLVHECINRWDIGDHYLSASAFYSEYRLVDKRLYNHGVGFSFIFDGTEVRADYDCYQLSVTISDVPQRIISSKLGSLVLGLVIFNALGMELLPNKCGLNRLPMYAFNSVVKLISVYSTIDKIPSSRYILSFDCYSRTTNLTMNSRYNIPNGIPMEEAVLIPFFRQYEKIIEEIFPITNKIVYLNIYNIRSLKDIPTILIELGRIIEKSTAKVENYKNIATIETYAKHTDSKDVVESKHDCNELHDAKEEPKQPTKNKAVKRMLEALINSIIAMPDAAMKVGEADNTYEGDDFHMHYKLNYHRASFRWSTESYRMRIDFTVSFLDDRPKSTITDFQIPTVEGKIDSKLYHFIKHGLCKYAYVIPMLNEDDGVFSGWE